MLDHRDIDAWLIAAQAFDGGTLKTDVALGLKDGLVTTVIAGRDVPKSANAKAVDNIVSPGFVDLQVNGGGGYLVNSDPSIQSIKSISAAHRSFGTTHILPTVITDGPDTLRQAVDSVLDLIGTAGIEGIHVEGPHISTDRRGTHKAEFVRPFDDETLEQLQRLRQADVPTLLTVAPEIVSPKQIEMITGIGVKVSLGHSTATAKQTQTALNAGANCFTHLFNAMSPMLGREPGVTGAAINSEAFVGIICDGIHVSDDMVGLALRARPCADKTFLVSDAMPTVGGPDRFDLYGQSIHLDGRRLVNSEGSLAGAHTTMAESVVRVHQNVGVTAESALRMAISIPAACIGLELDGIVGKSIEELILLDHDLNYLGDLAKMVDQKAA